MRNYFFIWILVVVTICGCTKNQSPNSDDLRTPLKIVNIADRPSTKSLVDGNEVLSQEIGFQLANEAGTTLYDNQAGNSHYKLKYDNTITEKKWKFYNGVGVISTVYLSASKAKIYAYYPYSASDFSGTGKNSSLKLNIPIEQDIASQIDYLHAAQDKHTDGGSAINNSNSSINLKMNHALSQIAFVIYKDGYTSFLGHITDAKLQYNDGSGTKIFKTNSVATPLSMKLEDGSITGGSTSDYIKINSINKSIGLTSKPTDSELANSVFLKNNTSLYFLTPPISNVNLSNLSLILTIDGHQMIANFSNIKSFQKGKVHYYLLKLSGQLFNATLKWDEVEISDNMGGGSGIGVVRWEDYFLSDIYGYDPWYGHEPIKIDGLIWAPVNAGYKPDNPYGLLYQWHRKFGQEYGSSTYTKVVASSISLSDGSNIDNKEKFYTISLSPYDWCSVNQTSWSMIPQYNPCPAGWRVPTTTDLSIINNLFTSSSYTWDDNCTDFSTVAMKGYWVGGNHAGDHKNSLFLPASGGIYINGNSVSREYFGFYTSSEYDNTSNNVKAFEFDDGDESMVFALHHKAEALSVRCVKNGS